MTEKEIKELIHKEVADILLSNNLTDNDIIIKQNNILTKEESKAYTNLDVYKQKDNFLIMIAKKAGRIINIIVYSLGVLSMIRFGSMLLFEKSLPDEITIAKNIHEGITQVFIDKRSNKGQIQNNFKEPEKYIVTSNEWENLNESEYKSIVYSYLSGSKPIEDLYKPSTSFVPASGVIHIYVNKASSTADDFKINLV